MPLVVDPWQDKEFTMSGLALSNHVRPTTDISSSVLDQSLLDDRTPLVTAGLQIIPAGSNKFNKLAPPLCYVEFYELLLTQATDQKLAVGLQIRILERKNGEQKFSTGMMRVDLPEKSENPMFPLGERIPVDTLSSGRYTLQVQTLDMLGTTVKRTAYFDLG
jgi:hypothetical protein